MIDKWIKISFLERYWSIINLSVSFSALGGPVLDKRFGAEWTTRIICVWCLLSLYSMSLIKGSAVVLTGIIAFIALINSN